MKLRSHLPHSHRLALVLAVLAVVAQLWMAQLSTRHLGAMLWQQTLWGEVCSTNDRTADADPQALSQIANCLCAMSSLWVWRRAATPAPRWLRRVIRLISLPLPAPRCGRCDTPACARPPKPRRGPERWRPVLGWRRFFVSFFAQRRRDSPRCALGLRPSPSFC